MPSLTELQDKRMRLVTQAREALDEISANTDESRSAELNERHDNIMAEFDTLEALIKKEERFAEIQARVDEVRENRRPRQDGRTDEVDPEAPTYRGVFAKIICGTNPYDLSAEERALLRKGEVNFNAESRAQTVGTAAAGGYTVPVELANELVKSMLAWGPMYDDNVARVINTPSGHTIKLTTVNDTASTAEPRAEMTAITDDGGKDVVFGQKQIDAYVYDTEFVKWSFELDADGIFAMEALLADLLGERLARIANYYLTLGDGSGEPNGVVTASTLGKTAAGAAAITSDELIDLEHSVGRAYRKAPKVAFMFNDLTLKAVRKLKDAENRYIWTAGDIRGSHPEMLLGYRIHINDQMADIATGNKTVLFGDFGKYLVRKVGGVPAMAVMRERFWPDLGIAGLIRFDGELLDTAAVKHLIQA
jgi:HK97 family phage major capsid protein